MEHVRNFFDKVPLNLEMQSWNKNAYYLTQELDGVSIDS